MAVDKEDWFVLKRILSSIRSGSLLSLRNNLRCYNYLNLVSVITKCARQMKAKDKAARIRRPSLNAVHKKYSQIYEQMVRSLERIHFKLNALKQIVGFVSPLPISLCNLIL
eukprot:761980_1